MSNNLNNIKSNNSNNSNNNMPNTTVDVDNIIKRLLDGTVRTSLEFLLFLYCYYYFYLVKSARPGKRVNLLESEVAYLCQKSRQVFLSQPVLLELEAPIKVCGIKMKFEVD